MKGNPYLPLFEWDPGLDTSMWPCGSMMEVGGLDVCGSTEHMGDLGLCFLVHLGTPQLSPGIG